MYFVVINGVFLPVYLAMHFCLTEKNFETTYTNVNCFRCSMALVHSRIKRVYYGSSSREGALGSRYKLHVQDRVNHHYQVFSGVLKDTCNKLWEESVT